MGGLQGEHLRRRGLHRGYQQFRSRSTASVATALVPPTLMVDYNVEDKADPNDVHTKTTHVKVAWDGNVR